VAAVEINRIAKDAAEAVARAEPALQAAKKALEKVDKKDIGEIKALANPPDAIKLTCCVCFHLLVNSKEDGWDQIKSKMLGRMGLVEDMKSIEMSAVTRGQAERVKASLKKMRQAAKLEGDELVEWIRGKSGPTSAMWCWAVSTDECYDIYKDVKPKQDLAAKMKSKSEKSADDLAKIQAKVKELQDSLAVLTAQKNEKTAILNKLEETAARLKRRLDAAAKLITGLGGEQVRWTADMANLGEAKARLVGDCLTASAFLSYCGPFNYVLRQKMLFEDWQNDLVEKKIPRSEDFKLDSFLTDEVEVSKWASEGLPTDELSVQNGILTSFASRWPLCIDPQMQAISWIKEKEKKAGLRVLTFNTEGFVKLLENAIKFGTSILFEGLDTELDPIIDPVLEKNITKEAGIEMLTLGDQKIEYNQDFRMALVTKLANPSYSPEIFGKTMIINFSVTLGGLKDQLLNQVVEFERPELEKMRKELIASNAANKQEQKELEDLLLSELSKESDVPLVDNEPLIKVLGDAKSKSIKIAGDLEIAAETGVTIEASRQDYTNVAKRGAILFFCMTGLSSISQMYEYSLNSYNTIFRSALETSKKDNVLPARIRFIIERLTLLFYEFVCMGIFEAHKLTFSFQMTTMIMDGEGTLDKRELDFFLKGNTSLDEVDKNPVKWLEESGWKNSYKLDSLGGVWAGFQENMKDYQKKWKKWFDEETPEQVEMPCGYTDKLSKFQQMLVCKVFRPDRCVNAIKNFIMDKMSPIYVSSPPIMYDKIYKQSTERTPIVFILSPGADPQAEVQRLADELGYGQSKFIFAALGQGMESHAKAMIERGAIRGHWIMLNNCHLLVKWLKTMEAIIENLQKPDKNFRLWLTTEPTDEFPLGILQKSLKVVTEPPDGLGANLRSNYVRLSDEDLEASERAEFKQLIYVLSFFHAVIQERKKYGKIGWNIKYDFNASDFNISFRLIALYLNKALDEGEEELPWETLRYLIGEAMYGGRVTDDFDRRVMNCYLQEYCGDFIFDTNQKFYFSRVNHDYMVPALDTHEQYMESIE
jgi:dynein heavy chain